MRTVAGLQQPDFPRPDPETFKPSITVPVHADTGMVRSRAKKALVAAGLHDDAEVYVDETNHLRGDLDALIAATTKWVNVLSESAVRVNAHAGASAGN